MPVNITSIWVWNNTTFLSLDAAKAASNGAPVLEITVGLVAFESITPLEHLSSKLV